MLSRLCWWGAISWNRDTALITPVLAPVRAAAKPGHPRLFAVDGCRAYVTTILKVFRGPLPTGTRGRPALVVWADLPIVQVGKQRVGRRRVRISRRRAHGSSSQAEGILQATHIELGRINTAPIEQQNATVRTWMPALVRRTRRAHLEAALFWTGCV